MFTVTSICFYVILGRQLLQKIEYDNRNRKFASESESMSTPQDVLDSISKIEAAMTTVKQKQSCIDNAWREMEKSFIHTKDFNLLEEGKCLIIIMSKVTIKT